MEAFSALNYFITFSSGHTERKSKWSGQFPDVTMGSPLSPGLDAITIFLHGVCDSRHRSSLNHYHPVTAAPEEILQFVRGAGEGFHLPLSARPICHVKYHDVLMEVRFGPPTEGGGLAQPHFLSLLTFCLAGRICGRC